MTNLINRDCLSLTPKELVQRASKYNFTNNINMGDAASEIATMNSAYGLAKIHHVQAQLGMESNANFTATPDETISRNGYRFQVGAAAYGGRYNYGNKNDKIIFPDLKPNSCGILVGALDYLPTDEEIISNVTNLRNDISTLDDIAIKWDFEKSNHFIDVFRKKLINPTVQNEFYDKEFSRAHNKIENYEYIFMIHSSAPEYKRIGPGMYVDVSDTLYNMCEHISTPLGNVNVLTGKNATKYYEFCQKANDFSIRRRKLAGEKIFGKFKVISNNVHQGMIRGMNEIVLGAQDTSNCDLLPIVLDSDAPAYLVMGLPNHNEEQIEELGWTKRAQNRGLIDVIKNTNLIPHGGGYELPNISSVNRIFQQNDLRYFSLDQKSSDAIITVTNFDAMPFKYRTKEVINKSLKTGICEKIAVLEPVSVIKF